MRRRRITAALAASLLSATASGCWLQVGFDAGHSRHNDLENTLTTENVATVGPAWSHDFVDDAVDEPVVSGGKVYLVTAETSAFVAQALDAATGTQIWETGEPYCCGAYNQGVQPTTWVGDALWTSWNYTGQFPGGDQLTAAWGVRIDPTDGTILDAGDLLYGGFTTGARDAAVSTTADFSDTTLRVVDAATKDLRWTAAIGPSPFGTTGRLAYPAVVGDQVLADGTDGLLRAYPLAGCGADECPPTWTLDPGDDITSLVADGDHAFATLAGGDLIAVDRHTGTVAWSAPAAGDQIAVADADLVYATTGSGWSAYPANCAATPCAPTAGTDTGAAATTAPVVAGGVLYVGTEGAVHAYDAAGCVGADDDCLLAEIPVGGTVDGLVVAEGRLFVVHDPAGSDGDSLTVFEPTT